MHLAASYDVVTEAQGGSQPSSPLLRSTSSALGSSGRVNAPSFAAATAPHGCKPAIGIKMAGWQGEAAGCSAPCELAARLGRGVGTGLDSHMSWMWVVCRAQSAWTRQCRRCAAWAGLAATARPTSSCSLELVCASRPSTCCASGPPLSREAFRPPSNLSCELGRKGPRMLALCCLQRSACCPRADHCSVRSQSSTRSPRRCGSPRVAQALLFSHEWTPTYSYS